MQNLDVLEVAPVPSRSCPREKPAGALEVALSERDTRLATLAVI